MLNLNAYLIKEHVGMLKLTDTYDIFDPTSGKQIGVAKEEPSGFAKFMRLLISKKLMPTRVNVYPQGSDRPLFSIRRGIAFFRTKVYIHDEEDRLMGYFRSKVLTLGGGFYVFDRNNEQFAEVKGDWKGWNFRFLTADGKELGTVTKKWAGGLKEFFTSADNYVITISEDVEGKEGGNMLLLAAGLAIDVIYKEGN